MPSTSLELTYPILVAVLTTQHPLSGWVCIIVSRSRNIDEQSTRSVNPSCINNIQPIRLLPIDIVRVDLQHVISAFWYARSLVMEDSHVVVRREEMHRSFGDLNIGVRVPW